ncbi:MAG: prolyl oligopeptidase family serine peptidase [Vicinamibacterales bacterium]
MKLDRFSFVATMLLLTASASAQDMSADYARAAALRDKYLSSAVGMAEPATWVGATNTFWYRRSVKGGSEFVLYDVDTRTKRAPFDHARLASALSKMSGRAYTAETLPFQAFTLRDAGMTLEARFDGASWRCDLADYTCTRTELTGAFERVQDVPGCAAASPPDRPAVSPDGKWEAVIDNYNVAVRQSGSREIAYLSHDGSEGNCYDMRSLAWSPDSKKLAAYRVVPGYRRMIHYVESSPADQLQPKHSSRFYAKPGDVLDREQPVIFDVVGQRKQTAVDPALFPNAYDMSPLVWRKDGSALTFEYNQRGHQVYRIIEVEAATGRARAVISEEPKTFFYYNQASSSRGAGKRFRFDIDDGKEIIWMSERDGWNHLYLFDGATGTVKNQITKGEWVVHGVEKVDTVKRQIWFSASGMYPGKDPYFIHYYRINFDGTGLVPLTEADADHVVRFSNDMRYYVDTWSRLDAAPVMELRNAADGSLVSEIERGDLTALKATGWAPPEVFVAKGRDGVTDIWGIIYRPTNFDPKKKYPVIESIYAGPHGSHVPKSFAAYSPLQAQAEIGFVVVQIDGMGTSNRSKAFHDVAWQNLADAGFPDRILWHKAAAAKYPWYDITRVGIYGGSAGGQNSLGALLFHPEFYKVAVSYAGCHDNRMDKIWWNEQWMGWPVGPQYSASSNVDNAWRLQGKVLLVVGELDTNVDPASTMQVVDALIKAGKMFDLLVIPGANHGAGRSDDNAAYGERKRFDFFVQHLLGIRPPDWNAKKPS